MKCTGASLSFPCLLASMMIGPVRTGSSSSRGSLAVIALLLSRRRLDVRVCLLQGIRYVFFFVCPSFNFPPPRSSGHPKIGCEVQRGCDEPRGWIGLRITPSDFSTRLPFDFIPYSGDRRLGGGDYGRVNVCVLNCRSEGQSVNRSSRSLKVNLLLMTPLCRLSVVVTVYDVFVSGGGMCV